MKRESLKTPHIIAVFAIFCLPAQAQITSIQNISSVGGLGPVTTIAPLGNGYSYATVGGPNNGWGSVQVSSGSAVSMGVTPRGGIMPIVTPAAPAPILNPEPIPVGYPEYIPIPVPQPRQYHTKTKPTAPSATATPYPKWKADAEKKEFNKLFAQVSDKNQFWKDFYGDWKVSPQTPIPLVNMIPYLRLWCRENPKSTAKPTAN
jgi:hypothetical protein